VKHLTIYLVHLEDAYVTPYNDNTIPEGLGAINVLTKEGSKSIKVDGSTVINAHHNMVHILTDDVRKIFDIIEPDAIRIIDKVGIGYKI
jgi:hypothetical protein